MVGTPAQPKLNRAGIALPTAIAAMTALAVLLAGLLVIVDLNAKTSTNRRSAVRALQVAEAGASHALSLLRGPLEGVTYTGLLRGNDGVANTGDDGRLTGFGLAAADAIPDTGRIIAHGRYFATIVDDPSDPIAAAATDGNNRVMINCRGVTTDGGSAEIRVVVGSTPFPEIVVDGTLQVTGNPKIYGACGSAHGNDDVIISGNPVIHGGVTAADTVKVSGSVKDSLGNKIKPLSNQPPIEVPNMNPADYCDKADYILYENGKFVTVGPPTVEQTATGSEVKGWKRSSSSPVMWDVSGNTMAAGTYCVAGNVKISGNPTGPGGTALPLTILATGSVEFSGNPTITPDHPDGITVISGGDLVLAGNPSATGVNGLFYSRSQCMVNGNPTLYGQIICDNEKNATGTVNLVSENKINGDPTITYGCGGMFGGTRRVLSWYQQLGS